MKKILTVILALTLTINMSVFLTACGNKNANGSSGNGRGNNNDGINDNDYENGNYESGTNDEKIKATLKKVEDATNKGNMDALLSCYTPTARSMYELSLKALDLITGADVSDILNIVFNSGIGSGVINLQITVTDILYYEYEDEAIVTCIFKCKNPDGESEQIQKFLMVKDNQNWLISSDFNGDSGDSGDTEPESPVIYAKESDFVTSDYLDGVKIDKYKGALDVSKKVIFPEEIKGKRVTAIDSYACDFHSGKVEIPIGVEIISPETDFEYFERDGKLTITLYTGTSGKAGVPAQIGGKPVYAVGESAFKSALSDVTIAEGVEKIYSLAFSGVATVGGIVYVPSSVNDWVDSSFVNALYGTNLKRAEICAKPGCEFQKQISETKDENSMYIYYRYKTKHYTVFTSRDEIYYYNEFEDYVQITKYLGDKSVESLTMPNRYNGKPITELHHDIFSGCDFQNVKLPDQLEYIGRQCFYNCTNLSEIELPRSLLDIGTYAFQNCKSLKKIHIYGNCYSVPIGAFMSCTSLTEVIMDEGVRELSYDAFKNDTALLSITFPDSVERASGEANSKIGAKYLCVYGSENSNAKYFAAFHGCEYREITQE